MSQVTASQAASHITQVHIKTIDGRESNGAFNFREVPHAERLMAGFKWLAISWGIAIAFVLVPIIHFVACPLFFILGFPGFYVGYRTDRRITGGTVECPACHEQISMINRRFETSFREVCPKCANQLYFTLS